MSTCVMTECVRELRLAAERCLQKPQRDRGEGLFFGVPRPDFPQTLQLSAFAENSQAFSSPAFSAAMEGRVPSLESAFSVSVQGRFVSLSSSVHLLRAVGEGCRAMDTSAAAIPADYCPCARKKAACDDQNRAKELARVLRRRETGPIDDAETALWCAGLKILDELSLRAKLSYKKDESVQKWLPAKSGEYEKKLRQTAAVCLRRGTGGGLYVCAICLAEMYRHL